MPFFSVVIPTYNRAALLREALDSVFAQEFTDFEVIVVDDGSTDDTTSVVGDYGGRIRYLRQENRGPGAARNLGIGHASGRYVAFLDSDDLWFPWSLRTYAEIIGKADVEPAFIAGKPQRFHLVEALSNVQAGPVDAHWFDDYLASCDEWRWWGVSSFVIRREVLGLVGGFANEPINAEDSDLALRLGTAGGFMQILAPETFAYREHGTNIMSDLHRTLAGVRYQLQQENDGGYPGGAARARQRRIILTHSVRPVSLQCLKARLLSEGWKLYTRTFGWNLELGRIRYLAAFPLLALVAALHSHS